MEERSEALASRALVAGRDRAAARAMLRAVGLTDEDFEKPRIGIANNRKIGVRSWQVLTDSFSSTPWRDINIPAEDRRVDDTQLDFLCRLLDWHSPP